MKSRVVHISGGIFLKWLLVAVIPILLKSMSRQSDKNYLVIRKRTFGELLDLTIRLVQKEGLQYARWFFTLAVPFAILNHFIVLMVIEGIFQNVRDSEDWTVAYIVTYAPLVAAEYLFVSSLGVIYLGKRVFAPDEKPNSMEIISSWLEVFPQIFFFLILFAPVGLLYNSSVFVIALERTPFRARKKGDISTFKRMRILHRYTFGESLVLGFSVLAMVFLITPGMFFCIYQLFDLLFDVKLFESRLLPVVVFPLLLWICLMLLTIFQFLHYLDRRIEREGWDVELAFRTERTKMGEQ